MKPCRAYFRPDGTLLITSGEDNVEFRLTRDQAAELAAVLTRYAHRAKPAAILAHPTASLDDEHIFDR